MSTESQTGQHDRDPQKEGPRLLVDVFTLTGHPGTGKTATLIGRDGLAPLLHIPKARIFQAGEEFRRERRRSTGKEVLGFAVRSIHVDRELDSRMTEFMKNSLDTGTVIAEGRLAGWIAKKLIKEETEGKKPLRIVSILLEAEEEIRVRRVLRRDIRRNPSLTIEEVRKQITERAVKDLEQWRSAYPELADIDPLDPNLVDLNKKRVYDLVVDTGPLEIPEVAGTIYNFLIDKDFVGLPPQAQIYPDP